MTVKESSTPVKDTFLGFYSQESFSSNSPENLLDENGQKIYEINSVEDFLLEFNNEKKALRAYLWVKVKPHMPLPCTVTTFLVPLPVYSEVEL